MRTFFLFFFICTIVDGAFCQFKDYKKGYIVLDNNDTLYRYIRDDSPEEISKGVVVKDSLGIKKVYQARTIRRVKIENDSYISVVIDTFNNVLLYKLLYVVSDGRYKLLRYDYSTPSGGIDPLDIGFQTSSDYYLMITIDQIVSVVGPNYTDILDYYYSDKLNREKKYRFSKIEKDIKILNE
jgi:hypothetical protein